MFRAQDLRVNAERNMVSVKWQNKEMFRAQHLRVNAERNMVSVKSRIELK